MSNVSVYASASGNVSEAFIAGLSSSDVAAIAQSLAGTPGAQRLVDQVLASNPAQVAALSDNIEYTQLDDEHSSRLYTARGGVLLTEQIAKLNSGQVGQIARDVSSAASDNNSGASINAFVDEITASNPALAKVLLFNVPLVQVQPTEVGKLYLATGGDFSGAQFAALNSAQVAAVAASVPWIDRGQRPE